MTLLTHIKSISLAVLLLVAVPALAAEQDDPKLTALSDASINGPADIPLRDQAVFHLPADMVFLPTPQVNFLLEKHGRVVQPSLLGLIVPNSDQQDWAAHVEYSDDGYIKDDEAGQLDADKILGEMRASTQESNAGRVKAGDLPLDVIGWIAKPSYDAQTHLISWSVEASERGHESDDHIINYNLSALGRQGLISLTFITDRSKIEAEKAIADDLLNNIKFNEGRRYQDFMAGTDKVAAYGLAALVTGIAAKKVGLLAMLAILAAKGAKLTLIAVFAGLAGLRKFFGRGKTNTTPSVTSGAEIASTSTVSTSDKGEEI